MSITLTVKSAIVIVRAKQAISSLASNFDKIKRIGENLAEQYGVKFLPFDFKKKDGFLKTNKISKELDLYRQNYCGCKFAK